MRSLMFSALALGAFVIPGAAGANEVADRSAAIQLCRAEISSQAGVGADQVRFDKVRTRLSSVRVDFDVWRDGRLTNVRCEVARNAGELTIASISPELSNATVAAR
ncbi:MAG TPA: hypothetical protein PLK37_14900 [Terricaulis sp.]|nr:hypothetical protein [Terricaulis sp.]